MHLLNALYNRLQVFLARHRAHYHRLSGATIGTNSQIAARVRFRLGIHDSMKGKIVIADHCELEQGVVLDAFGGSIELSERVFVGPYCVLYGHGGITVGENTMIAMQCSLVASNHTVAPQDTIIRDHPDERDPIQIGKDVWIGAGVRVLAGVTIADGCIVGAGSVVTDDLPPYSIAVGVPARVVKQRPSS